MTREGSFGGNADVSGTLTRNLMFFMRDLYIGYDGTVRNKHGNHVVQFSYASNSSRQDVVGGHPVGSLAACALSEAAYSALDQPVSILEPSPLMNLKGLSCVMSDVGKAILPEYLALTTDCLSATGEFVALNAKGLADQRKAYSVSAPFSQAFLKNPGAAFVKAAKMGSVDHLQGCAEALSWIKVLQ